MKPITKKNQYGRLVNDGWKGSINGAEREFTVVGVCGDNPVVRFHDNGLQGVLDWNKGVTL